MPRPCLLNEIKCQTKKKLSIETLQTIIKHMSQRIIAYVNIGTTAI